MVGHALSRDRRVDLPITGDTPSARELLRHVLDTAGRQPFAKISKATIVAGRDRRAVKTPFQARHFLDTMRGLFRWATAAGLVKADPTAGVADPAMPKSEGFPPWTEEDVAAYE